MSDSADRAGAGADDRDYELGSALFPELMRSEYHGMRKTLEAFSRGATIAGAAEASACGFDLRKGATWNARVRVTSKGGAQVEYTLDRWD